MTKELQGDMPFTKEQMHKLQHEGENHANFYKQKTYQDTGEPVGHQEHHILVFEYDGEFVKEIEGRDDPLVYLYAFDDPTTIDTTKMQNQDKIGEVRLDKAVPVEQDVGRQFDIVETNTFSSDDPLTELFQHLKSLEEDEE